MTLLRNALVALGAAFSLALPTGVSALVPLSPQGQQFLIKASQGGQAEESFGELADTRAKNAAVKKFGARMVRDHSSANARIQQLAIAQGVALPSDLTPKDQNVLEQLRHLKGAEFDQAYMKLMVQDHVQDVAEFRSVANEGKDPAVKTFAAQTLPTLQAHLDLARQVEAQVR